MRKLIDLVGKRFGKLVVLKRTEKYWLCQCDCGNTKKATGSDLISGKIKSCGCLKTKHSKTKTRLYEVWCSMRARCFRITHKDYILYGARGITVCQEWQDDFINFYNWAIANGYDEKSPPKTFSLDRIDVNGNYQPSNCRWATAKEQANNTRRNHYLTINNETHTIAEWAEKCGVNRSTLQKRIDNGWDEITAVTTPIKTTISRRRNYDF